MNFLGYFQAITKDTEVYFLVCIMQSVSLLFNTIVILLEIKLLPFVP